jgi:NADH:ubiquinone oxidoreductase subunit 3 (subunit A)
VDVFPVYGKCTGTAERTGFHSFHIAIELATAIILIWTGSVLKQRKSGTHVLSAFAQGMLAYRVMNSPGSFAHSGAYALVVMFFVLLVVAVANLVMLYGMLEKPV